MEAAKRACHEQEKNRMAIKLGGSGGGIGTVVLLAGALATTAVASAFIVGKRRWDSGKKNQRQHLRPPPTVSQDKDEATQGSQQFVLPDSPPVEPKKNSSFGATNIMVEKEKENDTALFVSTQSMIQDEKFKLETDDGGKGIAAYSDDRFYVPILDEKLLFKTESIKNNEHVPTGKTQVIDEDVTIHENISEENEVPLANVEEKQMEEDLPDDEETTDIKCDDAVLTVAANPTAEEVQLNEEITEICCDQEGSNAGHGNETNTPEYSQQSLVNIEENINIGKNSNDDGEIRKEDKPVEDIEVDDICGIQETISTDFSMTESIASENSGEDREEVLWKTAVGNLLMMEDDKKGGLLPVGTDENVLESNLQVELNNEDEILCNEDEGTVCTGCTTPANSESGDYNEDVQTLSVQMLNQLSDLACKEIAIVEKEAADGNQDVKENNPQVLLLDSLGKEYENDSGEIAGEETEEASEPSHAGTITVNQVPVTQFNEDVGKVEDFEDEVEDMAEEDFAIKLQGLNLNYQEMEDDEENIDEDVEEEEMDEMDEEDDVSVEGTGDLCSESLEEESPPELQEEEEGLNYQEIVGKMEEDKDAKAGKYNPDDFRRNNSSENFRRSTNFCTMGFSGGMGNKMQKTSTKNYMEELKTVKTSTRKKVLIGTVSVASSISCFWYFGLSFVKLSVLVFLTMALSRIPGY